MSLTKPAPILLGFILLAAHPAAAQYRGDFSTIEVGSGGIKCKAGSTCDASGLSVGGAPLSSVLKREGGKTIITPDTLQILGSGSTGPVDGMKVLGRELSARASEDVNVLDRGADPSGTTDSASPFGAAAADAVANKRAISVPSGSYRLNSGYAPPINVPLFARGANFTPGQFASIGDLTKYPSFIYFKSSDTPDTDNVVSIGLETRNSPAGSNYQKSGLFVRATTYDSGSCSGSPLAGCKDTVAITATGNIANGVSGGRAYAANLTGTMGPGSTGLLDIMEVSPYNNSGVDKTADFYTGVGGGTTSNINGIKIVGLGNAPSDAALYVTSGGQGKWAAGVRMLRSAVRDYVLEVNDDTSGNLNNRPAWIKPNGDAQFAGLAANGNTVLAGGFFATTGTFVGGNGVNITGGTNAGEVASISSQTGPVRVSGPSGKGALTGLFSGPNDPTVQDIPTGYCGDWYNETKSEFKHWCNYGNTMRGVVMN